MGLGVGGDREVGEGRLDRIWKGGEAIQGGGYKRGQLAPLCQPCKEIFFPGFPPFLVKFSMPPITTIFEKSEGFEL